MAFTEIEARLEALLRDHGPPRKTHHPEFPFWHLQTDGYWVVRDADRLPLKTGGKSPSRATLRAADARAVVPADLWRAITGDSTLRDELASTILESYWPESVQADVRKAVGLADSDAERSTSSRRKRDRTFREEVLRAYEGRCAVCGYDGRLGHVEFALEAAHVRWHCYEGPDLVENGLALCSLHHKALDCGAMGLTEDHHVLISADLRGGEAVTDLLRKFSGSPLLGPQAAYPAPARSHVRWHTWQVFHRPARPARSVA